MENLFLTPKQMSTVNRRIGGSVVGNNVLSDPKQLSSSLSPRNLVSNEQFFFLKSSSVSSSNNNNIKVDRKKSNDVSSLSQMKLKLDSIRKRTELLLKKHNWKRYFNDLNDSNSYDDATETTNEESTIYTKSSFMSAIVQMQRQANKNLYDETAKMGEEEEEEEEEVEINEDYSMMNHFENVDGGDLSKIEPNELYTDSPSIEYSYKSLRHVKILKGKSLIIFFLKLVF